MTSQPIIVSHFSDVLCIWAYIAQARVEQLKSTFQDKIDIQYHFITIFGDVERKLATNWKDRGEAKGYSEHVKETASQFDHISVHPEIWIKNRPKSSTGCHLFLKAVELFERKNKLPSAASLMSDVGWQMKLAFFKECQDISDIHVQKDILEKLNLPTQEIQALMFNGEAFAELNYDLQLASTNQISGSPTFLFNNGRQKLSGNVGYRLIEANVNELINKPINQASWC